jgi:hypothetical protein
MERWKREGVNRLYCTLFMPNLINMNVHSAICSWSVCARDNLRGQKSLGPLKMSHEMAHKVIVPQKKNYVPQFLKQRDINSYCSFIIHIFT